jgi:hypothetical protein
MLRKLEIDCTENQLKNKVKNLKKEYTKVISWRNQTGQGVLERDGEESFKSEYLLISIKIVQL